MRTFLAFVGALAILVGVGAAVFFFGGYYDVGATAYEPGVVRWALVTVREASVRRHAVDQPTVNLADPAIVRAGARAYSERGCVNCHGAPGVVWAKFSEGLRPDPPDPRDVAKERTPAELFFVVKNGVNMTGMPSFAAQPDQELWSIVAYLKRDPPVTEEEYKAWTSPASEPAKP
jgi:mono/diheme cytochrome c family protein